MNDKKARAGRLGGLQTALRYGSEQMRVWGRLGGRPRALTLEELTRRSELRETQEIVAKEDGYPGCNSLRKLKKLWRDRQRSTAETLIKHEAGSVSEVVGPAGGGD